MSQIKPSEIDFSTEICGAKQLNVLQRHHMAEPQQDWLAEEVPVALVYNGISHVVMMATPKDLEAFALGFSLSEGIITAPQEIYAIDVTPSCNGIEVNIELSSRRFAGLKERRRAMAGRTGCGVCGIEQLDDIFRPIEPLPFTQTFNLNQLDSALSQLKQVQTVGQLTGCTHAAAWITPQGELLGAAKMLVAMSLWINYWEFVRNSLGNMVRCWSPAVPAMRWCKKPPCVGLKFYLLFLLQQP